MYTPTKMKSKNRSAKGCSKLKSPEISSAEIGLNIRTLESPILGLDQVSGRVSVLCWHAAPVANILWKPLAIRYGRHAF